MISRPFWWPIFNWIYRFYFFAYLRSLSEIWFEIAEFSLGPVVAWRRPRKIKSPADWNIYQVMEEVKSATKRMRLGGTLIFSLSLEYIYNCQEWCRRQEPRLWIDRHPVGINLRPESTLTLIGNTQRSVSIFLPFFPALLTWTITSPPLQYKEE